MKVYFLDLDGVVVDFAQGCIDWYNLDCKPEDIKFWGAIFDFYKGTEASFWEGLTTEFWVGLKFTKEANDILTLLEPLKPCILTAPPWKGAGGKQEWIQKQMPDYFNEKRYLIGPGKHFLAHSQSLLIDDSEDNVDKFREFGGNAILVPRSWNRRRGQDILQHIKEGLNG